jgi:hypothetical protein
MHKGLYSELTNNSDYSMELVAQGWAINAAHLAINDQDFKHRAEIRYRNFYSRANPGRPIPDFVCCPAKDGPDREDGDRDYEPYYRISRVYAVFKNKDATYGLKPK